MVAARARRRGCGRVCFSPAVRGGARAGRRERAGSRRAARCAADLCRQHVRAVGAGVADRRGTRRPYAAGRICECGRWDHVRLRPRARAPRARDRGDSQRRARTANRRRLTRRSVGRAADDHWSVGPAHVSRLRLSAHRGGREVPVGRDLLGRSNRARTPRPRAPVASGSSSMRATATRCCACAIPEKAYRIAISRISSSDSTSSIVRGRAEAAAPGSAWPSSRASWMPTAARFRPTRCLDAARHSRSVCRSCASNAKSARSP